MRNIWSTFGYKKFKKNDLRRCSARTCCIRTSSLLESSMWSIQRLVSLPSTVWVLLDTLRVRCSTGMVVGALSYHFYVMLISKRLTVCGTLRFEALRLNISSKAQLDSFETGNIPYGNLCSGLVNFCYCFYQPWELFDTLYESCSALVRPWWHSTVHSRIFEVRCKAHHLKHLLFWSQLFVSFPTTVRALCYRARVVFRTGLVVATLAIASATYWQPLNFEP